MSKWLDLKELNTQELAIMANYVHQVLCPEPLCLGGMVPDEEREPELVEIFPGIGIMRLPMQLCPTCEGKGWMYAFSNN